MSNEFTQEVEAEIEVNGEEYTAHFTRITRVVEDGNYGADADGNRGVHRTFIDEDVYEDLSIDGVDFDALPEDARAEFEAAVEKWMEENDPELDASDNEPEYEPEDK